MYRFQLRRSPSYTWEKYDPILAEGEPGIATDTGAFKIGDGLKPWTELPYFVPGASEGGDPIALAEHIASPMPHPVYDNGPSLAILYENAKV
jgi:hypothetical protein